MIRGIALMLLCSLAVSCNTAAVKHLYMSLDQDGSRKRTVFYTDTDKIYCIGELAVGRKDVSITATIRSTASAPLPTGESIPFASTLAAKDITPGGTGEDVIASFEILKGNMDGPWSAGDFVCDLSIDADVVDSTAFQIQYPQCPAVPPFNGEPCEGFFRPQSTCVGGITAQTCVCSTEGDWKCR